MKTRGSSTYCRLEVDVTYSRSLARHSCLPVGRQAQAGIQFFSIASWIPVFTGMTILLFHYSDAHGRPQSNPMRDWSPRIGRPFRKAFTSPQGEGFRPSPKVTLRSLEFETRNFKYLSSGFFSNCFYVPLVSQFFP